MLINDKHIIRLYQAELLIFAFALPIYRKVIPYVIAVLVITWLLEGDFVGKARRVVNSKHRLYTLLFAVIYILYGIGLLYSKNFDYGFFDMEVKMSLFIFPVIMASVREDVLNFTLARKVLLAFVLGVFTSMIFCYSQAIFQYFQEGTVAVFYYSSLSPLIHPSYLAMYVSFAVAILLYFLYRGHISGKFRQAATITVVIVFELFVVTLSSKAGILSLALVLSLFTAYLVFAQKHILKGLGAGGFLITCFVIMFMMFPISSERFEETRQALQQAEINAEEIASSSGERVLIWWYSFEITNENFLLGVGSGDVKDQLLDKYEEKEMVNAFGLQLNAHNQYLQTMIALGIVGLIILMLNLVLPALYAVEQKHYLYLIFLILISFNFLFESMLETQAGVVFYAFFTTYLFAIKKDPASVETGP